MDILNTVVNAAVLGVMGILLSLQTRRLEREMNRRFEQVDRRFDQMDLRLEAIRSDLTNVALSAGGPRAEAQ